MSIYILVRFLSVAAILQSCATYVNQVSFSVNEANKKEIITPSKKFLIASNTKMFVGVSLLKLEEDGLLSTSDSITKWIPELKKSKFLNNWKKVTLDDLAFHVAHIPNFYASTLFQKKAFKEKIEINEFINFLVKSEYLVQPDEKFSYCNTCYILLGEVIRRCSKTSFNSFLNRTFFKKLGMSKTEIDPKSRIFKNSKHKEMHANDLFSDGNLISTPEDMTIWFDGILGKKIFNQNKTFQKFYNAYVNNYSYGVFFTKNTNGRFISHGGSWANFHSRFKVNLDSGDYYFFATSSLEVDKFQKIVDQFDKGFSSKD
ncbi:MAG: beta-lactamase family protein [Halobacteriovoraceae bacterium]|nr:beta-lactamase family protein [Halobacteriovoraceae bacterium]